MWTATCSPKCRWKAQSSALSSLVTQTTPGVAADSNGLFHGLGDHASNSFSVDGQSITDQQSKVFSNQLPSNSIQSIEVISGAPPAEYGGKTSLVIVATTRSGQGVTKPTGSVYASYGSFGSATGGFDLSYGGKSWGNFIEVDGLNTGRFLDPPEFTVFHDKGNEENFFDRVDYSFTQADSIHLDLNYSRSWFQTPNSYDNLNVQNVVGARRQRQSRPSATWATPTSAPRSTPTTSRPPTRTSSATTRSSTWAHFSAETAMTTTPAPIPLADLGPSNLQTSSISQYRTLTNAGVHADYSYVKGVNNLKIGAQYEQTFLREHDSLGVVDSTYNSPCVDVRRQPVAGLRQSSPHCNGVTSFPNANYLPVLAPYDLTRGGAFYNYFGHTDVKELALYIEDEIKAGNWDFNLGLREDVYNGLTDANQTEPRVGIAYNIKPSGTVCSISYARTLETPFNENLVLSSKAAPTPVLASAASLHSRRLRNHGPRLPQRVPRQSAAGHRQVCGLQRRVHLEVHAQRLRLQRARQHAHHLPHRLAQLQDSRLCAACRGPELPQLQRLFGHVLGGCALLPAAGGRSRSHQRSRSGNSLSLPHRPRREVQPDHPPSVHVSTMAVGSTASGAASTGATTRAWSLARCLATTSPIPNSLCAATSITLPGGVAGS